jgi:hypothetical protein
LSFIELHVADADWNGASFGKAALYYPMQPSSVFAVAASRLHADLMIIRLNRAGISRDKISAVFPASRTPNAAVCWMDGQRVLTRLGEDRLIAAGPLRQRLDTSSEASLAQSLRGYGLGLSDAGLFAEKVFAGEIVICVHTDAEPDAAIAWHTLRELEAEGIALGVTGDGAASAPLKKSATASQPSLAVAV